MRSTNYLKIGLSALGLGLLLCAWQQEWISFRAPWAPKLAAQISTNASQKKNVTLYYWQHDNWQRETRELLWQSQPVKDLKHLVALWLEFLISEQLITHKVALQSALIDEQSQTLYLSFDRELFSAAQTTPAKLMLIEGLLKTLRDSQPTITQVYFFLQHQPLPDRQLDFSTSWPITGFM